MSYTTTQIWNAHSHTSKEYTEPKNTIESYTHTKMWAFEVPTSVWRLKWNTIIYITFLRTLQTFCGKLNTNTYDIIFLVEVEIFGMGWLDVEMKVEEKAEKTVGWSWRKSFLIVPSHTLWHQLCSTYFEQHVLLATYCLPYFATFRWFQWWILVKRYCVIWKNKGIEL